MARFASHQPIQNEGLTPAEAPNTVNALKLSSARVFKIFTDAGAPIDWQLGMNANTGERALIATGHIVAGMPTMWKYNKGALCGNNSH